MKITSEQLVAALTPPDESIRPMLGMEDMVLGNAGCGHLMVIPKGGAQFGGLVKFFAGCANRKPENGMEI